MAARWPGMPADRVLGGRQGCSLGGADGWQESGRAGWPERPHARGAGGLRGLACGRAGLRVAARGRARPLAWCFRGGGRDAAWRHGRLRELRSSTDSRDARTSGGPEARLAAALRSGGARVAGHARWPGTSGGGRHS